jgi:hypothetical protein
MTEISPRSKTFSSATTPSPTTEKSTTDDIVEASSDAQERLQRCMEALSFFKQYPIRLVQEFDVDRRNNDFIFKYLHPHSVLVRLPGGERETPKHFRFQRRIHQLPRDDQLLDLGCGVGARVFEHRKELVRII